MPDNLKERTKEDWEKIFSWWRVLIFTEDFQLVSMVHHGVCDGEEIRRQARKCMAIHNGYGKALGLCPY